MKSNRKPSAAREKDLRLALLRLQRSQTTPGKNKVTIAAVAREAGVSAALIHNYYPNIAEAVRVIQGRASRTQRDKVRRVLSDEFEKNRALRMEIEQLRRKVADLASINEVLLTENRVMKAKQNGVKVIDIC